MDEFDEGIETTSNGNSGSKLAMVALWIGIVGIVVGVTGILLANQAQKRMKSLEAELAAQPDKTPELEKALESMEERLVKLGSEFVKLGRQDRQLQENTQKAFDSVLKDVKANREGLNEATTRLTELVAKLENWNPSASRPVQAAPPSDDEGASAADAGTAAGQGGEHVVRSGDTLSKIAKQYGVTLSELQRANPTVNPRALQIGQRLVIPSD